MQYMDAISKIIEIVRFQGKPFNITEIQVYAPTSSTEEAEVEQFYEDLQDLLELTPKKDVLFIIRDWNAIIGSQETFYYSHKYLLPPEQKYTCKYCKFCNYLQLLQIYQESCS